MSLEHSTIVLTIIVDSYYVPLNGGITTLDWYAL